MFLKVATIPKALRVNGEGRHLARFAPDRDLLPVLAAAARWIDLCLVNDGSIFSNRSLWTSDLAREVHHAFVDHPDESKTDFMSKLEGQMAHASPPARQLMAEMIWALLLFPSNMKPSTKRDQIVHVHGLSGAELDSAHPYLRDEVLIGIGSGGMGFHNYRPDELAFLITIVRDIKGKSPEDRKRILFDYDAFVAWIEAVPRTGARQLRHMLRYFAFPDRVERMSSNTDRCRILEAFAVAPQKDTRKWSDQQLDDALLALRTRLSANSTEGFDFYSDDLRAEWSPKQKVKTPDGEVEVVVPRDDEDEYEGGEEEPASEKTPDARHSLRIQGVLAEIGRIMGFKVWIPRADRARVLDLVTAEDRVAFVDDLPLNYDDATLSTIQQIDVLWLKGRSIIRAFEVEHTTAVYSGLLRMADLLALQPNMAIRLHIVAPEERREKVMREMLRPVFSLLDRGPLAETCTYISYDNVQAVRKLEHLAYTSDSVLAEYEERAQA